MATTVVELHGIPFHVEYQIKPPDILGISEVRALGEDYKPVGPDLGSLFNNCLLIVSSKGAVGAAVSILSLVGKEIEDEWSSLKTAGRVNVPPTDSR
jgi:hypothetical protein